MSAITDQDVETLEYSTARLKAALADYEVTIAKAEDLNRRGDRVSVPVEVLALVAYVILRRGVSLAEFTDAVKTLGLGFMTKYVPEEHGEQEGMLAGDPFLEYSEDFGKLVGLGFDRVALLQPSARQ